MFAGFERHRIQTGDITINCVVGGAKDSNGPPVLLLHRYAQNLKHLYETPTLPDDAKTADQHKDAAALIDQVRSSGRTILTEIESKQLLARYNIPTVPTELATSAGYLVALGADRIVARQGSVTGSIGVLM